jgi:hypothetical protein
MQALTWSRDPAASGWRSRALVGEGTFDGGKRFELIAYDDGRWEVRGPPIGHTVSYDEEKDGEAARARCLKVWAALT